MSCTNVLVSGILELSLKGDEFRQRTKEEEFKLQQGRRTWKRGMYAWGWKV